MCTKSTYKREEYTFVVQRVRTCALYKPFTDFGLNQFSLLFALFAMVIVMYLFVCVRMQQYDVHLCNRIRVFASPLPLSPHFSLFIFSHSFMLWANSPFALVNVRRVEKSTRLSDGRQCHITTTTTTTAAGTTLNGYTCSMHDTRTEDVNNGNKVKNNDQHNDQHQPSKEKQKISREHRRGKGTQRHTSVGCA